jgi:hypothetical protein
MQAQSCFRLTSHHQQIRLYSLRGIRIDYMDNRQPLPLLSSRAQTCRRTISPLTLNPISFPAPTFLGRFLYWTIRVTSWLDDGNIGDRTAGK